MQLPKERYLRVVPPQNKSWHELHKGDIRKRTCPLDPNNCKSVNQETDSKPFQAVKVNINPLNYAQKATGKPENF